MNISTISVLFFLICPGFAFAAGNVIAIDPGHEPTKSGALGTCGKSEVVYNDLIGQKLITGLDTYSAFLTRQPGEEVKVIGGLFKELAGGSEGLWRRNMTLMARPALANAKHADAFISIHHDSVSKRHQVKRTELCDGKGGVTVTNEFRAKYKIGFNVFVNNDAKDPNRSRSIKLAKLIGHAMILMGRTPSDYHFYPVDDCKSCEPVDKKLGVWHHDLAVLRHAKMPAVLIEVGNIVDHEDEHHVNNDAFRTKFVESLKSALNEYFSGK
jgi:N-acetylmuramoyl-L-alanine amidase